MTHMGHTGLHEGAVSTQALQACEHQRPWAPRFVLTDQLSRKYIKCRQRTDTQCFSIFKRLKMYVIVLTHLEPLGALATSRHIGKCLSYITRLL